MRTLRLFSTLALASTIETLRPGFEAALGARIDATLLPTALLIPRIQGGAPGDVAILTDAGVDALVADGTLRAATKRALAWSSVGIAVASGAPRPAIGTEPDLVATLLAARSIGLSRAGASGIYFETLLRRLGIAEAVQAKATVIESGYTAQLAADGQVELAVQQVSELMMVPGIDVVGPLPPGLGAETLFAGAVFANAAEPEAAAALLDAIAAEPGALRRHGLAPA